MNYRHGFHAGNHADVLKHMALVLILDRLRLKETPFGVLDTHAGAGVYDLTSDEARRSPEHEGGIGKLAGWTDPPAAVARYLDALQEAAPAPTLYPGSPALIAALMRAQDRLAACELHPEEAAKLAARFARHDNVQVHQRDGYEGLRALLPLPERRGLVLIDPPFEAEDELARATHAIVAAHARMRHAIFMLWRPLKDAALLDAADAELPGPLLRADLAVAAPALTGKLMGSSLAVINPPFGLEESLREALPVLAERLAVGGGGYGRVRMR